MQSLFNLNLQPAFHFAVDCIYNYFRHGPFFVSPFKSVTNLQRSDVKNG